MKRRCHQTSVSDHSCNHNPTCQCDVQTHYSSVHDDRSSTQLLYIGKSFHCKECDEGREFKDCRSDTEVHKKPSNQLEPAKPSPSPSECTNYKQMLKQIINMSQKVLDRIEKKEQKKSIDQPCHSGRKPSAASCAMSIHVEPVQLAIPVTIHFQTQTVPSTSVPCPSITGSAITVSAITGSAITGMQKPLPCIQSEPQPCNQPSLQRSIQFGAQKDIECNLQESIVMQPNIELNAPQERSTMAQFEPGKCASTTFPLSSQTQNEVCVSQGKFPQQHPPTGNIPNPDNVCGNVDMICVSILNNRPEPEPPRMPQYKAENILECDMDDRREDVEETDEKAIQTDRRHGRKKEFQDCAETDSYECNSYIVTSAQLQPSTQILQIKVSKRSITCKTLEPVVSVIPCGTNGSMKQSITLKNQEAPEPRMRSKWAEERLTIENIDPQLITQPTNGQLPPERLSASQQVPFPERLSVSQQPLPERLSVSQQPLSERLSVSQQPPLVPERMSVSQQEPLPVRISVSQQEPLPERLSLSQQRVSFSNIARPSANVTDLQQQDQLQELLKEQELYENPPPPIDQSESPPITSQIPQNMNYPSQFRQSLNNCNLDMENAPVSNEQTLFSACFEMRGDNLSTNILLETTSVCQCEREASETSCLSPTVSSDSISAATLCIKPCGEISKKSICLVCPEDVFYSAHSGSDTEEKIQCKKEKKTKKEKETSSSQSAICAKEKCSLIQVLERMMQVLETMNARAQQAAKPPSPCSASQKSAADISIISIDASRNMQRRNFQCLNKQNNPDSNANESGTCGEKQRIKKPCKSVVPRNKPCIILYGLKSEQLPCLSVRVGNDQSSIQAIPTAEVDIRRSTATTVTDIGQKSKDDHTSQYQDEEECMEGNILMRDEIETINEANIKLISTEECQECYDDFELIVDLPGIQIITNCVQTQTEQCYGPFPATGTPDRTDILSELCAIREELSDVCSCSYQELMSEMMPKITSSGGDVPCECDCCFCRAERNKGKTPCQCCECCRRDLKALVDTVILDLESMEMTRNQNERCQAGLENSLKYKSSFPVSITEVTELGKSSLYVKWTVHDGFGIGGYEIYVDGYLKNRYFNSRHEAAVVCDIDVSQPHKIALLARPKDKCNKTILGAGDVFIEEEESPLPSNWTPSTYLYEPSKALDYMKCF